MIKQKSLVVMFKSVIFFYTYISEFIVFENKFEKNK